MLRSFLLAALLAGTAAASQAAPPDYSAYQALLDQYLVRAEPASKTSDTRFDYEKLYLDEKLWTNRRSARLDQVHAALLAVRPSELAPADRVAWAINTYNFLVIERAVLRLIIPGKRFVRHRSVDEMKTQDGGFFTTAIGEVEGRRCTLAEFERRYVCGDTTDPRMPRGKAADPRWSLALSSGHLGDPPLAPQAYRGETLEAQLDAAARTALAQPRLLAWDDQARRLQFSAWFAPRAIDYPGSFDPFFQRYGPPEVRKGLRSKGPITRGTLPYDPKLSQASHPDAMPEGTAPSAN